jgi:hypothetical protein
MKSIQRDSMKTAVHDLRKANIHHRTPKPERLLAVYVTFLCEGVLWATPEKEHLKGPLESSKARERNCQTPIMKALEEWCNNRIRYM